MTPHQLGLDPHVFNYIQVRPIETQARQEWLPLLDLGAKPEIA